MLYSSTSTAVRTDLVAAWILAPVLLHRNRWGWVGSVSTIDDREAVKALCQMSVLGHLGRIVRLTKVDRLLAHVLHHVILVLVRRPLIWLTWALTLGWLLSGLSLRQEWLVLRGGRGAARVHLAIVFILVRQDLIMQGQWTAC